MVSIGNQASRFIVKCVAGQQVILSLLTLERTKGLHGQTPLMRCLIMYCTVLQVIDDEQQQGGQPLQHHLTPWRFEVLRCSCTVLLLYVGFFPVQLQPCDSLHPTQLTAEWSTV
jgi:hypothetical protein